MLQQEHAYRNVGDARNRNPWADFISSVSPHEEKRVTAVPKDENGFVVGTVSAGSFREHIISLDFSIGGTLFVLG